MQKNEKIKLFDQNAFSYAIRAAEVLQLANAFGRFGSANVSEITQ